MKKHLLFTIFAGLCLTITNAKQLKKNSANKNRVTNNTVILKSENSINAVVNSIYPTVFVQKNNQVISSIKKGNTTLEQLKFKDGAVQRNLVLDNQNILQYDLSTSPLKQQQAAVDTTFYESWEGYDGSAENWIPANWTEQNKTGNTFVSGSTNPTWYVRGVGSIAVNGTNIAWVDFNDTGLERDEWIVSPAFTPATSDYLCFDLYYAPYFMYFDMAAYKLNGIKQFDFSKPTSTMQVMVSTDGGNNWIKVWDVHNLVAKYNETNIGNYQNAAWNSFNISMTSYSGKSVKIAFRYVGKGGDSMGLDNVGVRLLKPQAKYGRPQGFFYLGLTPKYENANTDLMLGAAFEKDNWRNQSNHDSQSFVWTFEDQKDANATFSTSDIYPQVQYPNGFYGMPNLNATSGSYKSDYKWGVQNSGFFAGGNAAFDWGTLGAGNYDLSKKFGNYTFAVNDYIFGTGPDKTVDGICNYFEKPVQKYLLDSLWISLGTFKAPAGTVFNLKIRRVNPATGDINTILAKSTCTTEDVKEVSPGFYSMLFKGFITYDAVLGLEVTNDYLVIEDGILVEMYGFNKTGIELSAFCQSIVNGSESNAYVFYNNYTAGTRTLRSAPGFFKGYTSLLFNLGISYPFLNADENTFTAPMEGGSKTFNVSSYSLPTDWWMDDALPTWLISSQTYDEVSGAITYTLTAEPLPAGMVGRGAKVIVSSAGADMAFNVSQGEYTGVSNPQTTDTKVKIQGDNVELSYTTDFKNLSIYNVTGQNVGSYNLSSVGKMTLTVGNLNRGIYMFKFSGKKTETVKVIR